MPDSPDPRLFEPIAHAIYLDGDLLRVWALTGGVSAEVTGLEIKLSDGQVQKLVVRRHGSADLQHNPRIATDEFALMNILHEHGLPSPKSYYVDESGTILPTPFVVVEFIDGAPDFAPADLPDFIRQLADALTQIHHIRVTKALDFLPRLADRVKEKLAARPESPDESLDERRIRAMLEAHWPPTPINLSTLLHGDFWPGNALWKDGHLQAIIDWEDALTGDPLADVANMRLELMMAFGQDAMTDFTREYETLMPALDYAQLAFWDLWAALRPAGKLSTWGLAPETEAHMRTMHKQFVAQALDHLARG